jgi:hypothetical protein
LHRFLDGITARFRRHLKQVASVATRTYAVAAATDAAAAAAAATAAATATATAAASQKAARDDNDFNGNDIGSGGGDSLGSDGHGHDECIDVCMTLNDAYTLHQVGSITLAYVNHSLFFLLHRIFLFLTR